MGERVKIAASVGTRLAIGAYPLAFVFVFGWTYGKQALDVAAAAINWASYLNLLLLSGFLLVPPAVSRLRVSGANTADIALLRDHLALERILLLAGLAVALVLWATIPVAFPALAEQASQPLATWYALFAVLALSQIPLTLWLGIAQAAERFGSALVLVAVPRALALGILVLGDVAAAGPTAVLIASIATILIGQFLLVIVARRSLDDIDPALLRGRGRARNVLAKNLSGGLVVLVGSMVTLVPVTLVGRLLPEEVGHAYAIVALSNAVGAVIVATFFPISLTLAERLREVNGLLRYCVRIARNVALITLGLLVLGSLGYWVCSVLFREFEQGIFGVAVLAVVGAGLRLAALGVYHAAAHVGHPHYALPSVAAEAIAVVALTWLQLDTWRLYALGVAFVVGGVLRLVIAFSYETRLLSGRAH